MTEPDGTMCRDCPTTAPMCAGCFMARCFDEVGDDIVINEVDADTTGTDMLEFIELYDGGSGGTSLDGLVLVLYNGSSDTSYFALDLDGRSTDSRGFFILGNAAVVAMPSCATSANCATIANDTIQNGADAVALYTGDASDFPTGTAVTATNLLDAVVYDTSDADDTGLLSVLTSGHPQVNENGAGSGATDSIARWIDGLGGPFSTESYVTSTPTPLAPN
jgi:hypothetical protein